MVELKEFKKLMVDLSILTGKTPTAYGKSPKNDDQLDYMIEVYHQELKNNDCKDIEAAFQDRRLREEITSGYSLNVSVIEKYIVIHRNKRNGKTNNQAEERGERKAPPAECNEYLKKIGIDVNKLAESKSYEEA